ncbi:MAG: ATP-binding protein [Candidatus Taylorbacteria bacterium]
MDIITIVLVIATCTILGLGVAVVLNSKEKLNQLYFLNIMTILGWAVTMMYYRLASEESIVLWARLLYVAASLVASNFLYFTYVFPKYREVSLKTKIFILAPNLVLIGLCLVGNTIITGAEVNPVGENIINWGILYPVYVIYILIYFNLAFYRLIRKRAASVDVMEKMQLTFVLLGYMSSGFISFTTNLILPSFGIFILNWVGQVSTVLMAISATYAIIRHRLFNAQVIATELLTFLIWVIILVRLLVSESSTDLFVNGVTFLLVFVVGILLIRSVVKEISQRERIELLAADLQAANDNQVNLIHVMNHQIKGKLGDARAAFAELLTDDYGTVPEEAKVIIRQGLEQTVMGVDYVQGILKGMSASNGSLPYDMKDVDLKALVKKVTDKLAPKAAEKKLAFEVNLAEGDFAMTGDTVQLSEAVSNMISNSISYTPSGSIHVWLTKKGNKALLAIQDTGIGISAADKTKLFKSGGRGKDSIKVNVNSTGYGLSFVKGVVEAHHGRVWAESDGQGKGASFYVELGVKG